MPYIVACKLPNGLDIGGFVLRGSMVGHEDHQKVNAPGRERVGGYEITRGVPDEVWLHWLGENSNGPIVRNKIIMGFLEDGLELPLPLQEFCMTNRRVKGWSQASQEGTSL